MLSSHALVSIALAGPPDVVVNHSDLTGLRVIPGLGGDRLLWTTQRDVRSSDPATLRAGGDTLLAVSRAGLPANGEFDLGAGSHFLAAIDGWAWDYTEDRALLEALDVSLFLVRDLDGDGLDDLFSNAGVFRGGPELRVGPRVDDSWNVQSQDWWQHSGKTMGPVAFPIGDLDGDGRGDLLRGYASFTEPWHEAARLDLFLTSVLPADGETWVPAWSLTPEWGHGVGACALAQLDADPDEELLVYAESSGGALLVYDAPRADRPPEELVKFADNGEVWALDSLGDLDGDGDDELLIATRSLDIQDPSFERFRFLQVIEADLDDFWTPHGLQPDPVDVRGQSINGLDRSEASFLSGVAGDFDGDGARDVAVSVANNVGADAVTQIWFNTPLYATSEPADTGTDPGPTPPGDTGDTGDTAADPGPDSPTPPARRSARGCDATGGGSSAALGALGAAFLVAGLARGRR